MPVRHPASRGSVEDPAVLDQNIQNGNYTLVASDKGKLISKQSGGAGETITIPANSPSSSFDSDAFDVDAFSTLAFLLIDEASALDFAVGTMIAIENSGGGNLTIAIVTDILIWTFDGTTGSRTLADEGVAILLKISAAVWKISGDGLS